MFICQTNTKIFNVHLRYTDSIIFDQRWTCLRKLGLFSYIEVEGIPKSLDYSFHSLKEGLGVKIFQKILKRKEKADKKCPKAILGLPYLVSFAIVKQEKVISHIYYILGET